MVFYKAKCKNCGNLQTINDTASMIVKCNKCNVTMQKPRGGKAQIRAEIIERLK